MAALLITYDLHDETYSDDVLGFIKQGKWKKVTKSSYVVIRNETPFNTVTAIRKLTKSENEKGKHNVTVCVLTVRKPFNGLVTPDVTAWLDENLPDE